MEPFNGSLVGLNSGYTFETLVVGLWNRLAYAAARSVVEQPGVKWNPLYLCGGSGLGKTHLVQAIVQAMASRDPGKRVIYVTGRRLVEEFVAAVSDRRVDEFRTHYRGCDALVVDDVEGISGMERCQLELFEIFNALYDTRRQIVLTSACLPLELQGVEARLASRFAQGLVADIELPDFEARVAILRRKAEFQGIELPETVVLFVATEFAGSVRVLEGALLRIIAHASSLTEPITLPLAYGALAGILLRRKEALNAAVVQRAVANYFNIKVTDMRGPSRYRRISVPRQIAMYLIRKLCGLSYPEIGQSFGGKDHSSVITACRKTEARIALGSSVRRDVAHLERVLQRQVEEVGDPSGQAA